MTRTLGISILIVLAVGASLTFARQRQEGRAGHQPAPGRAPALDVDLSAIRSAGF